MRENTRAACETQRSDAAVGEGERRTGKAKPKRGNFSLSLAAAAFMGSQGVGVALFWNFHLERRGSSDDIATRSFPFEGEIHHSFQNISIFQNCSIELIDRMFGSLELYSIFLYMYQVWLNPSPGNVQATLSYPTRLVPRSSRSSSLWNGNGRGRKGGAG